MGWRVLFFHLQSGCWGEYFMLCERVCVRAIDIHKWVMAGGVWIVVAVFKFKLDYKCALHVNI